MEKQKAVFVTGWGQRGGALAELAEELSDELSPVLTSVYELIETEALEPGKLELSPSKYARALERFLPNENEKAILLGVSTGGLACLETALCNPERVSKLVLISSTPCFLQPAGDPEYSGVSPVMLRAMMLGLKGAPKLTLKRFFNLMFAPEAKTNRAAIPALLDEAVSLNPSLLQHGLSYLEQQDLRALLPSLKIPVLLIHGEKDQVIPLESASYAAQRLPRGQLNVLKDGSHALIETACATVADEVRVFLKQ